jgi:methyl-accepting chemotaxis protein
MTLSNILTLVFSSGALFFSFLNYKRGRRFDNENFIYKTKVEVYVKILGELEKLVRFLGDNIEEANEYLEKPNKENFKILNDMADEVDETCYEFNNFITGNSLIIPENIVKLLSDFCDKVLDSETIDSDTESIAKRIDNAEKMINELIKEAEDIGVELRKDLHVDKLNTSLFRRLK